MRGLLFGIIVGGALVYGGLNFHVLRTTGGVEFVPKATATLSETYVDVRTFTPADWAEHQTLAAAVIQAKKTHIFQDAAVEQIRDGLGGLLDGVTRAVDDATKR